MKYISFFAGLFFIAIATFAQSESGLNQYDAEKRQHGQWKKYNKDTLKYEGSFNHGIPEGDFIYYYSGAKIKAKTNYSENGSVASTTMYFTNGNKMAEGKYVNKKREGKWINYDGQNNIISEVNYLNGKKHGICLYFYPEGKKLEEVNYDNGVENGNFIQYFSDGNIKTKGNYKNGKYDGLFAYYFANGKVYNTGRYDNNIKNGDWIIYDETSKPVVKTTYKNGKEINRVVYQKDKDPDTINKKMSEEEIKKRGTSSTDNGINDPRYDGY